MCLRIDTPEPVGSLLRVTLREVDGKPRLEGIARIVWSSPTIDGGHWIGLSLLEPDDGDSRRFARAVSPAAASPESPGAAGERSRQARGAAAEPGAQ
jgi:hypothetical protein